MDDSTYGIRNKILTYSSTMRISLACIALFTFALYVLLQVVTSSASFITLAMHSAHVFLLAIACMYIWEVGKIRDLSRQPRQNATLLQWVVTMIITVVVFIFIDAAYLVVVGITGVSGCASIAFCNQSIVAFILTAVITFLTLFVEGITLIPLVLTYREFSKLNLHYARSEMENARGISMRISAQAIANIYGVDAKKLQRIKTSNIDTDSEDEKIIISNVKSDSKQ